MTLAAERAALVAHARTTIAHGSRSFRFASRLFDPRTRERAWLLYAWCRACDDLADGQSLGFGAEMVDDPDRRLRHIIGQTQRALAGECCHEPPFDSLRVLAAECPLPARFVREHVAGFARDCSGWRPETQEDLLSYCYQVAGAVGCLMAVVMGVDANDDATIDRACDLGMACQLANILRDLADDHAIGRCYLPGEWLDAAGLTRVNYMASGKRDRLLPLVGRLYAQVRAYQASARIGAARLPWRSRWAVLSAARIYGTIATKVEQRGASAWDSRTTVSKAEKLRHVLVAAGESMAPPPAAARSGLWTRPR